MHDSDVPQQSTGVLDLKVAVSAPGAEVLVVLFFPVVLQRLLSFEVSGRLAKFAQERAVFVFCLVSEHVLLESLGISRLVGALVTLKSPFFGLAPALPVGFQLAREFEGFEAEIALVTARRFFFLVTLRAFIRTINIIPEGPRFIVSVVILFSSLEHRFWITPGLVTNSIIFC